MDNGFTFAGQSSGDFGMRVEKYPAQGGATRKRTTINIPGRNGDLHYEEDAFENYKQKYQCYFHSDRPTPEQAHAIKGWLLSADGYQRLEDVYDPDCFRLASFVGPLDVENILNRYGRCTVTFDCAPQSFLKSGEWPVSFDAAGTLYNPTRFTAQPMITVLGSGSGKVSVGGTTVEIKAIENQIILDCELMDAYREVGDGAKENKNSSISAPEFPVLQPGENTINWDGGITGLEIIPRWWTL